MGRKHGGQVGKVKAQTPVVPKEEKPVPVRGRARKRELYEEKVGGAQPPQEGKKPPEEKKPPKP